MELAYLVTDRSRIAIIAEFPYTLDGFNSACACAVVCGQMPEIYPSGVILEKRTTDMILEIVSVGKFDSMKGARP